MSCGATKPETMHEEERQKHIKRETIYRIYDRFDGITWYLQRMLNKIFSLTEKANDKMMEKADDKTRELADDEISIEKGFSKLNPETNTYEFDWDNIPVQYTIYGEGYGRKIQGCGSKYIKEGVNFIGFDVKIQVGGISYWLLRENRDSVFKALNTPTCPYKGQFTIDEAIKYVRKGFKSEIAEDKEFLAEGLVLRSPCGLLDRRGKVMADVLCQLMTDI